MVAMATAERGVARPDVTVKMDGQTVRKAKMVAASRGIPLAQYLTEIVAPIVDRDLAEATRKALDKPVPLKPPARPKK
jgi:hypothetical protein